MLSKTCILQYMINFPGYWMEELWRRPRVARTQAGVARSPSHECLPDLEQSHPKPRASDQPCTLQYIIHFPGSRCCPNRVFYSILFTFLGLGGAPETARCCPNRVFYNILLTLPGLGGAAETARSCPNRV